MNGRGSSVHIYSVIKMCQDSLHKMEAAEGRWGGGGEEKSDRKEVEFRRLHQRPVRTIFALSSPKKSIFE